MGEESAADGGGVAGAITADTVEEAERSISELCAGDWGLWRTITANVAKVLEHAGDYDVANGDRERMTGRLRELLDRIEREPKSFGWKMRAKIGDRKRWYDLPEEVEGGP